MALRLPSLALSLALAAAVPAGPAAAAARPTGVLVAYSFEEESLATGPDTFSIFDHARGRVDLSPEMALSGWASIRIEDVAGDGDFPELQGYFEARSSGTLHFHFALLVAEPDEELNVALAGPAHFALGRDGIAFWLRLVDGELRHVSDGIPKPLVRIRTFVWYAVDVALDLSAGRYDLTVREEGLHDPVARIVGALNASNAPASAVDKFSFIGDLADRSRTVHFVDDVLIGVDDSVHAVEFAAPGRRRLFLERCWRPRPGAEAAVPCPQPAGAGPADAEAQRFEARMSGERFTEALEIARGQLDAAGGDSAARALWCERAAAAAASLGLLADAEELLAAARREAPARASVLVALSDLAFLRGDLAAEREAREAVYGSLSSR